MRGKWTVPGDIWPSAHLVWRRTYWTFTTRCGRSTDIQGSKLTPEPPATGKTCERCLVLSRRDG